MRQVDEDARGAQFRRAKRESDRKLLTRWVSGLDTVVRRNKYLERQLTW
jgi:hypothetical protein